MGLSLQLPTVLQGLFQELRLRRITRNDYATLEDREKIAVAKESRMIANTVIVPGVLLKSGKAKDEGDGSRVGEGFAEAL